MLVPGDFPAISVGRLINSGDVLLYGLMQRYLLVPGDLARLVI